MRLRIEGRFCDVSYTLAVAAASFGLAFGLFWVFPWITYFLEFKALPFQMKMRRGWRPSGNVAVVAFDDRSLKLLGREKWSDGGVWAALERALSDYRVSVIGFAMVLPDDLGVHDPILRTLLPHDPGSAEIDPGAGDRNQQAFAKAIADQGSTYLGCELIKSDLNLPLDLPQQDAFTVPDFSSLWLHSLPKGSQFSELARSPTLPVAYPIELPGESFYEHRRYLGPPQMLTRAARGVAFLDYVQNGAANSPIIPLFLPVGDRVYVPFSLAIVSRFLHDAPLVATAKPFGVAVGKKRLPTDSAIPGLLAVNFADPLEAIRHYSVSDILEKKIPTDALANKIIVVGFTTSLSTAIPTYAGDVYLADLQANFIENVLTDEFVQWPPMFRFWCILISLWLMAAVGLALLSTSLSIRRLLVSSLVAVLSSCAFYYIIAVYYLRVHRVYVNWVVPLGAFLFTYSAAVANVTARKVRERRRLRGAFEHYLDRSIIETVLNDPAGLELGGELRHVSVLFSDIVNFTGRVESTEPHALVDLLNEYMSAMTEVVLKSGGVVDKLIGDSVMAFWGAPVKIANSARTAVECGLDMLARLRLLHAAGERFRDLEMGVGVATGEAIVGNFGGLQRFDYSVLGDRVNLAARLESLTRQLKVQFLIDGETLAEAGDGFVTRYLGLIRVKGKSKPAEIFEVVGRDGDVVDHSYYDDFSRAVRMIHDRRHAEALSVFQRLVVVRPDDPASELYLHALKASADQSNDALVLEFMTK